MELHRNNHYVPQMYLRNWAKNNKIWVYHLLVSNENFPLWNLQSLENTASMQNLYMRIEAGDELDDIEQDFNIRFETPAKEPLLKACTDGKLSSDDWEKITDYVAAQMIRTPAFQQWERNLLLEIAPAELDKIVENLQNSSWKTICNSHKPYEYDGLALPFSIQKTGNRLDENHVEVEISTIVGKSYWLMLMKSDLKENSELRIAIRHLKWSIASAPEGCYWPTSDNPVVISKINENGLHIVPNGINCEDTIIFSPISPTRLLIASKKRLVQWRFTADKTLFKIVQRLIVDNAFMYVYHWHNDMDIPNLRERTVDLENYKRIYQEYKDWFNQYKESEAPLL